MIPHTIPAVWPDTPRSRFASLLRETPIEAARIALIGIPDDMGVRMNGGRPGAAQGPGALRAALAKYGVREPAMNKWPRVCDAGDVAPGGSLDETHERVTLATSALLDRGLFPIAIGGGHDLTFAFVRAVAQRHPPMTGVYFDAHLDVRTEPGSGMPFRALIEQCNVRALHVHGLDVFSNSTEHASYFAAHGGRIDPCNADDPWPSGDLFVSLDLDVIDAAHAPGVSAMNPCGWSPAQCEQWVRAAAACERVRCFDIMELNPEHDEGGRTARLAARLLLAFLAAFMERGS